MGDAPEFNDLGLGVHLSTQSSLFLEEVKEIGHAKSLREPAAVGGQGGQTGSCPRRRRATLPADTTVAGHAPMRTGCILFSPPSLGECAVPAVTRMHPYARREPAAGLIRLRVRGRRFVRFQGMSYLSNRDKNHGTSAYVPPDV